MEVKGDSRGEEENNQPREKLHTVTTNKPKMPGADNKFSKCGAKRRNPVENSKYEK